MTAGNPLEPQRYVERRHRIGGARDIGERDEIITRLRERYFIEPGIDAEAHRAKAAPINAAAVPIRATTVPTRRIAIIDCTFQNAAEFHAATCEADAVRSRV
jgi:hypothetical protein